MSSRAMFWEHATDSQGGVVREDVRHAANNIWKNVCITTRAVLGDDTESAEILERCLGRVSRYLDAHGTAMFAQNVNALLFVSFRRELWSVRNRRRIPVDIVTCGHLADVTWPEVIDSQLDFENLVRQLSDRSQIALNLRRAGYAWKEVAAMLGTTVPEIKSSFWREVVRLKSKFMSSIDVTKVRPGDRKPFPNHQPLTDSA
jgi:DNA-directed RNA polymerase specialized sigma24 family protein